MAQNINLQSPTARRDLAPRQEYYPYTLQPGLTLLFRRAPNTNAETWAARARVNKQYFRHPLGAVTKAFDFKDAKLAAEAWYATLNESDDARHAAAAADMTVSDLVKAYIEEHQHHRANPNWAKESTQRAQQVVYKQPIGGIQLANLKPRHINALQSTLRKQMSGTSVNRATAVLRAALNWGYAQEYILAQPHKTAHRARPNDKAKRRKFKPEQCVAFISGAPASLQPILTCMFYTACRPVGARRLRVKDVDLAAGEVTFTSLKGANNDEVSQYQTSLDGSSLAFFTSMTLDKDGGPRAPDEFLFRTPKGLQWGERNLAKALSKYRDSNALDQDWEGYSFRHSIISYQVNNGMPAALAAEEYGTSIEYIQNNYYEPDKDLARQFAAALSFEIKQD